MARGGSRSGTMGTAYSNRSDLAGKTKLPITVGPSQHYGEATQLANDQREVPMGNPPVAGPPPGQPAQAPQGWQPGQGSPLAAALQGIGGLRGMHQPTGQPNVPVTAGLPTGAGPGPEALTTQPTDYMSTLRAAYAKNPTEPLRELIAFNESQPQAQLPVAPGAGA